MIGGLPTRRFIGIGSPFHHFLPHRLGPQRDVMNRIFSVAFSVTAFSMSTAAADDARQVIAMEIDAGLDSVWNTFTTPQGLKS